MIWQALFWAGIAIVLVPYAGYPLWIAGLARLRPAPANPVYLPDEELPEVTCVMAAADEGSRVGRKLEALSRQDYPSGKLAVVVVNDASTDDTDRVVSEWSSKSPRVRLLRTSRRSGKPTALNLARPEIDTGIAVMMDVRQDLSPCAIRELVAHLQDPAVGAVSGQLRVRGDSYWTYEGSLRKWESRSGSMVQVTGSLYALRTGDLPEIPPDTILDDVYVPLTVAQTGRRIVMAEKAESLDVTTRSVGSEFVRKVRTLAGLVQICHSVKGCLSPARNPVWARFLLHKLGRLVAPYGLALILAGALLAPGWGYRLALAPALGLVLLGLGGRLGLRSRLASLSQSVLALNLAALWAVPSYYLGRTSVVWARVETDRT